MATHCVLLGPVVHGGARYEDGEEISLAANEAAALLALGVISEALPAKEAAKPGRKAEG